MREVDRGLNQIGKRVESSFDQNLPGQSDGSAAPNPGDVTSLSYEQFKKEQKEDFSFNTFFEKFCNFSERYVGFIGFGKDTEDGLKEEIEIASMVVTPRGVTSGAVMSMLLGLTLALPFIVFQSLNFMFFIACTGAFMSYVIYTYPGYLAEITKIRAQQESLLSILYMTIYMRVNPIMENAMYFAAQHLNGPLGKDLKQVLWLVDNEKVANLEEGIQFFIPLWVKRNPDFVSAILVLHSVLKQSDKDQQARIMDKSLDMILSSTYEKMKHYSHDLQMPVTMLHTFGMMLPLIGLIAFPMISIFMSDAVNISWLFFGYVIVLPALLYFFTRRIIAKRPGAFSTPDITNNPFVPPEGMYRLKWGKEYYLIPALNVAAIVTVVLILPGIFHLIFATVPAMMDVKSSKLSEVSQVPKSLEKEYEISSIMMTLTIPMALGFGIALYFYLKSIQKLKIRNEVIEIEEDLGGALFQFANQFTERIPVEVSVENFVNEYVMLNLKKRSIFEFFSAVLDRMNNEGADFTQAIFDQKRGVIIRYPSILLKEITWIISEGAKKGSMIVYNIVTKISIYLDNVKKVKELIYDLLTETVASINMQAKILAPFIAALVGSLTLVIIRVLFEMARQVDNIMKSLSFGGASDSTNFFSTMINFTKITPPTVFQVLVGIYMVQTVILLSILANGVENGFDKVAQDVAIARNLFLATIVYVVVTIVGTYGLNSLVRAGALQ